MSTKHSFSTSIGCLLSLFLLAPLAACSAETSPEGEDEQGSAESDLVTGKKKATCASVFGQCVALTPGACKGGTWADAATVTCGGGLGVGCCVKPTPPPPPPPQLPCAAVFGQCVGIAPGACTGGTWADAKTVTCGPGIGVGCCVKPTPPPPPPPPPASCASYGGACVGLSPSSCSGGRWADASKISCGSGIGVGCCLPPCPMLSPPAPNFCPGGKIVPKKEPTGCTVGYECVY